jgi:hypothetical protein
MLAQAVSYWIRGVDARRIDVEAHVVERTLPGFAVVGLADRAVQEARQRVHSGMVAASFEFPDDRVIVNLAPAREPKQGSGFDLAIALAVLAASGQAHAGAVARVAAAAELGLDGRLRPIAGTIAIAEAAGRDGLDGLMVAPENAAEAAMAESVPVLPAFDLYEAVQILAGRADPAPVQPAAARSTPVAGPDLAASAARPPRDGRSRSPQRAPTTCSWSGRPARARRCWPAGCPASCRRPRLRSCSRSAASTPWPACSRAGAPAAGRSGRRTTARRRRRSSAAARCGLAR